MNLFVTDTALYQHCKKNTLESVKPFLLDRIGKQWLDLMNINSKVN